MQWVQAETETHYLKGQCHEMDIFWRSKHFNQYFLCMRWWFQEFTKVVYYLIQLLTFYLLLWHYLLILKKLSEILLRFPFSVIGQTFSSADTSLPAGKRRGTGGFRYDFTESQAASCKHFKSWNSRFRVFKGTQYWDFFGCDCEICTFSLFIMLKY